MNASASPRTLWIAFLALVSASTFLCAQDVVIKKNNVNRDELLILGVSKGNIRVKVGAAETTIPLDQVESVRKAAPKGYNDALAAWQAGNAAQALTSLKPVVDTFIGLPIPWAERGSALLGDLYLATKNVSAAEAAFAAFQEAYPGSTELANLGLARLAIEKNDFASAKTRLEPIVAEAKTTVAAPAGKGPVYGQAYYLLGMVHESEGAFPEALRDYLSAVTIYYEDPAIVAKAQERATALMKDKQVNVP